MLANNAKMSISHISHSHSRRYWYCDADRSRASWRPPSGGTGACPRAKPRVRGTCIHTVPAGGKYSESPRRCQGRGRGPAEKRSLLHKRTCAKLVHAAASHHRGPCAVAQPLPPYRCPHRVHHAPIALQPTHSCTNALAPNLFMLRPRTIAAPVQWPSPCRCPHRVHHGPIALQPTHGRPGITRKDCSRDALWSV